MGTNNEELRDRLAHVPAEYDPTRHNYALKAARLIAEGKLAVRPGCLTNVVVIHDDWCALLTTGSFCDCDPEVRVG
jgi:hypothetical protein